MKNYYDDLLLEIEKFIKNKDFDRAYNLIIEEKSMPYIPLKIEEKLDSFLKQLNYKNNSPLNKKQKLDLESIISLLNTKKDIEVKSGLILLLNEFNLVQKKEEYQELLLSNNIELFLKKEIIKILLNQNIKSEIKISTINSKLNNRFTLSEIKNFLEKEYLLKQDSFVNNISTLVSEDSLELEIFKEMSQWLIFNSYIANINIDSKEIALLLSISRKTNNLELTKKIIENMKNYKEIEKDIILLQETLDL